MDATAFKEKMKSLVKTQETQYEDWRIQVVKGPIMGSKCESGDEMCTIKNNVELCNFCRFEKDVKLASLPDMVFAENLLKVQHKCGFCITVNTFGAIAAIKKTPCDIEVAHAKAWQDARKNMAALKVVKNFDWTYFTTYCGDVDGPHQIELSGDKLDLDKLRQREPILFYEEVFLYEDELDDNGCTRCSAKIRIMPSGFLLLLRHYLRIDHKLIKIHDTRIHYEKGNEYLLRELSLREATFSQITAEPATYRNPDLIWQHLPLIHETTHKISWQQL